MNLDLLVGIFGLLFVAANFTRVCRVQQLIKRNPIIVHGGDTSHDFVLKVIASIVVLAAINIVLFRLQAYFPHSAFYGYLQPISPLISPVVQGVGLVIAYLGLGLAVVAQSQMGEHWRFGNDTQKHTDFVRHGLFKNHRHPIYAGFIAVALGLFLATPNILSLLCAVMTSVVLPLLARMEEEFQVSRHGDAYKDYLARTRRWI